MSSPDSTAAKKGFLLKLVLVALAGVVLAVLLLRGVNLKELVEQVFSWMRGLGPWVFFTAMAILPAFGFPLLGFVIPAGPVFAPQLGMQTVVTLVVASITANLLLSYWLARYGFRPVLEGIVKRLGYKLPQVSSEDHLSLTILIRVTPGPPFFLQNYILGLANVPLRIFLMVSFLVTVPQAVAVVFFGESLMSGKGKVALIALSLIVALSVLIQWVRRKYARKKKAAAVEA